MHAPVDGDGVEGSGSGSSSSAPANPYAPRANQPAVAGARTTGSTAAHGGAGPPRASGERSGPVDDPPQRIQKKNTGDHDDSAARLWRICRDRNRQPVDMSKEEIEGRGAEHLLTEFVTFATAQPIPINFDDDLNPRGQSNRCCVATTLTGYGGKYLKRLREIYPDHPDWKDLRGNEVPKWWTALRAAMFARCSDNQMKWQGKYEWGTTGKRPLYIDLGVDLGEDPEKSNPLQRCDLKHVIAALVQNAGPHNSNVTTAAQICSAYDAVARGGEVKFQKFTDWSFDYLANVLDTKWHEPKTVESYGMPRIPDRRWWFDFYCLTGAYGMCDNGFFRSEQQIADGLQYAVFPDLHKVSDNHVTTQLGEALKGTLPPSVKDSFSAKSMRMGGVNELAMQQSMNIFMACARTGHSTSTNLDSYLDGSNPLKGLPAALALHGRSIESRVVLPDIDAVGHSNNDSMRRLVDEMFAVSIPEFQDLSGEGGEKGVLRDVLETFAAALLLHHPQVLADCGHTNKISSVLIDRAEKAKISYAGLPGLSPAEVLLKYSEAIRARFEADLRASDVEARAESTEAMELSMMSQISRDVREMKHDFKELADEVGTLKQSLAHVVDEKERYRRELEETREELEIARQTIAKQEAKLQVVGKAMAASPKLRRSERGKRQRAESPSPSADGLDLTAAPPDDAPAFPVITPAFPAPAPAPAPSATSLLRNSNRSEAINNSEGDKGKDLSACLAALSRSGRLRNVRTFDQVTFSRGEFDNPSKVRHCLTLVDFAGDAADIAILKDGKNRSELDILSAATRLSTAATKKMFTFEGTTADAASRTSGPKPGEKILGLSKRIMVYRNRIKDAAGYPSNTKPESVDLIEYDELLRLESEKDNGSS